MNEISSAPVFSIKDRKNNRAVATWLLIGVGMVIIQIALGGITRLTGSGLSITQWNVVTGALPPLSEQKWLEEFARYKATPQYRLLNSDFTLSNFKFIFFWEWLHRFWARLLGVVFAIGFVYFLATKKFNKDMVKPLLILFCLGALQGLVGWIMVASGFVGDAVYVEPTKLAMHFVFALILLCYTFWFALQLIVPKQERMNLPVVRSWEIWILILLLFQLVYGALMAGHKAATAAPTWPDINGAYLNPAGLYKPQSGALNFLDNKIMIQYVHRGLAYLLLISIILLSIRLHKEKLAPLFKKTKWLPMITVSLQVLLGILTVLSSTYIMPGQWGSFEWMAQLHQLTGMCLLLVMVYVFYLSTGKRTIPS